MCAASQPRVLAFSKLLVYIVLSGIAQAQTFAAFSKFVKKVEEMCIVRASKSDGMSFRCRSQSVGRGGVECGSHCLDKYTYIHRETEVMTYYRINAHVH